MSITFTGTMGKEMAEGRITVPKRFDSALKKSNICPLRGSVEVLCCVNGSTRLMGKLYHSRNNNTTYFQFYIPDSRDRKRFETQAGHLTAIRLNFDLHTKCLSVDPVVG
jgi:hypothetical protein